MKRMGQIAVGLFPADILLQIEKELESDTPNPRGTKQQRERSLAAVKAELERRQRKVKRYG